MTLRPATLADIPFIRAVAGRPENTAFITDEDDAALAAYLADPAAQMLIWETDAMPAGFAIFCGIGNPTGGIELRRLALSETGTGRGLALVRALTDHGFDALGAGRVWLDASGENVRAQRIYDRAGYQLEGRQRAHWWRPALGRAVDLMLYGMMRDEWRP